MSKIELNLEKDVVDYFKIKSIANNTELTEEIKKAIERYYEFEKDLPFEDAIKE